MFTFDDDYHSFLTDVFCSHPLCHSPIPWPPLLEQLHFCATCRGSWTSKCVLSACSESIKMLGSKFDCVCKCWNRCLFYDRFLLTVEFIPFSSKLQSAVDAISVCCSRRIKRNRPCAYFSTSINQIFFDFRFKNWDERLSELFILAQHVIHISQIW